jgi:HAD superfamily hydrolase (TIGR01459 family)
MKTISGLSLVADQYDALLLDLWGVIHDGTHLYPGVHDALTQLRKNGKKIIMLSNAPRRAYKVDIALHSLGIEPALYDAIVSSGEVGYAWMASKDSTVGTRYFYIGPDKDIDVIDGLNFTRTEHLVDADFLLNVGFGSDEQSSEEWTPVLNAAQRLALPMVCLNPDLEVVKISGARFPCAGVIAHAYEAIGGTAIWFGKPYAAVYDACMQLLPDTQKSRILAIGDSLDTDIPGALSFGIDCVLITGGILKTQTPAQIESLYTTKHLIPTFVMPQLAW